MSGKKGFFNFFRSRSEKLSNEDKLQREYAIAQEEKAEPEQSTATQTEATSVTAKVTKDEAAEEFVLVFSEEDKESLPSTVSEIARDYAIKQLNDILKNMGFDAIASLQRASGNQLFLEISCGDDIGRIIGKEGNNLEALQILLRAMIFKIHNESVKLFLDADGYRNKRREAVKEILTRAIKSKRQRITLKPMNASERRLVHALLQNEKSYRSYSQGNGNDRHIVLEKNTRRA